MKEIYFLKLFFFLLFFFVFHWILSVLLFFLQHIREYSLLFKTHNIFHWSKGGEEKGKKKKDGILLSSHGMRTHIRNVQHFRAAGLFFFFLLLRWNSRGVGWKCSRSKYTHVTQVRLATASTMKNEKKNGRSAILNQVRKTKRGQKVKHNQPFQFDLIPMEYKATVFCARWDTQVRWAWLHRFKRENCPPKNVWHTIPNAVAMQRRTTHYLLLNNLSKQRWWIYHIGFQNTNYLGKKKHKKKILDMLLELPTKKEKRKKRVVHTRAKKRNYISVRPTRRINDRFFIFPYSKRIDCFLTMALIRR